jgi:hypothetical protein
LVGDLLVAAPGVPAGQGVGQLGQRPSGLGQGLLEAAGLRGVQGRGVREQDASVDAEHDPPGVVRGQLAEPVRVDHGAPPGRQGEQVRMLGRGQRADEVQPGLGQVSEFAAEFCPASNTTVGAAPARSR